jgi:hypothetical protein
VKDLEVTAPFHDRLRGRCPDSDDENDDDIMNGDESQDGVMDDDESEDDTTGEDEDDISRNKSDNGSEDGLTTDEMGLEAGHNMIDYGLIDETEEALRENNGYDGIQDSELGSNDDN